MYSASSNPSFAVSDDIDPASVDAVLWSLAYRSNPIEDVQLVPYRGGVQGAQYGPEQTDSSMLVYATRKRPMAPLALPTREHMEHARELWERLGLHPLTVTSPWHGYHLGDWTETWETFAQRAAAGDWALSGIDTLARQRTGVPTERENVLVTTGATGGLGAVAGAIVQPGDEVLVLAPHWPLIAGIVRSFHGVPVEVPFFDVADSPESAV